MRSLAHMLALSGLAMANPAIAQENDTSNRRLEMIGEAPAACVLGQPTAVNAVNASFTIGDRTSGTIGIPEFIDLQTAETLASSIDLEFPVTCNASHSVTLRSTNGGMLREGAPSNAARSTGGFREFVGYDMQLGWAGKQIDLGSETTSAEIDAGQPAKGELVLRVATPAGSGPLVAGQYSDAIIIEFNAGI